MTERPVFITGLGIVSSIGGSAAEVVDSLRMNRHGFANVEFDGIENCPVSVIGTVDGYSFPSSNYLAWKAPESCNVPRSLGRSLPPHGMYVFSAIQEALKDAGLEREELGDGRTGLCASSAGSPYLLKEGLSEMDKHGGTRGNPMGVVSTVSGTLNFNFGNYLGIRGANCGFVSACSSSAHGIGYAFDEIRLGRQDRMIVLAGEDLQKETLLPFWAMRALSPAKDPSQASCPFDQRASGFVGSGGGVCLILESGELQERRRAKAYTQILGWGQTSDGFSTMAPHPEGEGLVRSMEIALRDAGSPLESVDYISSHATSTRNGDLAETRALLEVLATDGGAHRSVPIAATKSLTGHTLSMAGALQAAIACLSIREGIIPGNPGLRNPIEEAKSLDLVDSPRSVAVRKVLSNSSGFGGTCVSLLLGDES
ncbi:MAG: beta-ketoacyl-[acyl-carrier-protein] synthase family protein [Puniceicoccales bacterium]